MSAAPSAAAGGDPEEAFRRACELEAQGRADEALAAFLALRAHLPAANAPLEMQIAALLMRRGELAAALEATQRAVAARPDQAAPRVRLAGLLLRMGRAAEARQTLRDAVAALPHESSPWARLASLETDAGEVAVALECLARAAATMPTTALAWREIGQAYLELFRHAEAERALTLAAALDPGAPAIEALTAYARQELGDTEGARQALERAGRRDPDDLRVAIGSRLLLPHVYEDHADLARWRARYAQGLGELLQARERLAARAAEVFEVNHNNFLLAYQGEDDTALQRDYAALVAGLVEHARPALRERRPVRFDGARRLRVGFLGTLFRDTTAGRYFERWVTGLDPARFERFVYHTGSATDGLSRRIAAAAEHFTTLRLDPREGGERVLADALDVLVFPEVGMAATSYVYAAMRLAPVQVAGWGHPVTTGADAIDAYFTCAEMEPVDGDAHYTERLVRLPGLGVDYSLPAPPPPGTRAELGLPADRRLYVCAQSLFKVHPDMDELVAGIAAADERAIVLFFHATSRLVTEALAARLQRGLARRGVPPRGQVKFLPRMDGAHFRRVLALADVVLDTPRWSGGNTSIDAFAVATPVVTLPGRFMRGRQTAGMLRLMGIEGLAAASPAEYVRIAVETARDGERNRALREAIARGRGALFDDPRPVGALAQALLRLGAGEAIY